MVLFKTLSSDEVVKAIVQFTIDNAPIIISDDDTVTATMLEDGSIEIYIIPELDQH